jgi:hypothetical protein
MISSQNYDAAVVGLLLPGNEKAVKNYLDATTTNTVLANGTPFAPSAPTVEMGPADANWHERTGFGNSGNVFTSAESGGEDAPALLTSVSVAQAGLYDIWVNFWANPTSDWRVKAGFTLTNMQVFRSMACRQVKAGEHTQNIVTTGAGNTYLYQAYLGRAEAKAGVALSVYVDDYAIKTGSESTLVGDVSRSWYDGVSYRQVKTSVPVARRTRHPFHVGPVKTRRRLAEVKVRLPAPAKVIVDIHELGGKKRFRACSRFSGAGEHNITWRVPSGLSGIYIVRILAGKHQQSRLWSVL